MFPVHFHLYLSHFPIAGIIVGFLVLLIGKILKQEVVMKTGLWILFLASFSVFAMDQSGEGAEEVVEEIEAISNHLIHEHEEAAEKSLWIALISGLLSLFTLWAIQTGKKFANKLVILVIVISMLASAAVIYTASKGGLIRHSEEIGEKQIENENSLDSHGHSEVNPRQY